MMERKETFQCSFLIQERQRLTTILAQYDQHPRCSGCGNLSSTVM